MPSHYALISRFLSLALPASLALACVAAHAQSAATTGANTTPAYDPRITFAPLTLPDPVNAYRSSNGAPGPQYYKIDGGSVTLSNRGQLVLPTPVEATFKDGSKTRVTLPVETWMQTGTYTWTPESKLRLRWSWWTRTTCCPMTTAATM